MSTDGLLPTGSRHQDPGSAGLPDFDAFYNAERPHVIRRIRAVFGPNIVDGIDAEDIAQKAFLVVFESWRRIGDLEYPRAYTDKVALRIALKTLNRRSVPLTDTQLDLILNLQPGPEENLDRFVLLQALKRLAPRQAQVVGLQLDGLDDTDIAATLNITTDAVRSHRRHAKIALRHPTAETQH
ncbi:RNA polymerase sigma factor [Streptomyces sp. NPDC056492]|uniref:RNA polymerase sigma factor n=1 Tax=unclassified Streptomyces TaxID=2593676 RepID=UPI0036B0BFDA